MKLTTRLLTLLALLGASLGAAQAARIMACEDSNFRGRCVTFEHSVPDLARLGFNDRISSVRAQSGRWRLCRDANYQDCFDVDPRGIRDLAEIGFNDAVSSLQLIGSHDDDHGDWNDHEGNGHHDDNGWGGNDGDWRKGHGRGVAILFEDSNFSGRSLEVRGAIADLNSRGFNDRTSSIRIIGGHWLVCQDANFQGRCIEIHHSVTDLNDLDFNDVVSSIRPLR